MQISLTQFKDPLGTNANIISDTCIRVSVKTLVEDSLMLDAAIKRGFIPCWRKECFFLFFMSVRHNMFDTVSSRVC